MGKRKGSSGSGESQYPITQANLDKKGKTNKKVKRNPLASKYLSAKGQELRDQAKAYAEEHFKKGRRTKIKEKLAEEARLKQEKLEREQNTKRSYKKKRVNL